MSYKKILVLLIFTLISQTAKADDITNVCPEQGENEEITSVYYINGVGNTEAEARESLQAIQSAYEGMITGRSVFDVLYNPTEGLFPDVSEVLTQRPNQRLQHLHDYLRSQEGIDDPNRQQLIREYYILYLFANGEFPPAGELPLVTQISPEGNHQVLNKYVIPEPWEDEDEELRKIILINVVQSLVKMPNRPTESVVLEFTSRVEADLLEGNRVILIAHSQGNLFANAIIRALPETYKDEGNIGMIGVASPASSGPDIPSPYFSYSTAEDDIVINALRIAPGPVLRANVDNDYAFSEFFRNLLGSLNAYGRLLKESSLIILRRVNEMRLRERIDDFNSSLERLKKWRGLLNHEFLTSYFKSGLPSRRQIDTAFRNLNSVLEFPEPQLGRGAITVRLNWNSDSDMDLHVFEPNGTHVYYADRVGVSGHIDLDDTDGYGPEHYYVCNSRLETGTYSVGINYFRGNTTTNATLRITTGSDTEVFSRSRSFSTPLGYSGDSSPSILANIYVTQDDAGEYSYLVLPPLPSLPP